MIHTFEDIEYLQSGNERQQRAYRLLKRYSVMDILMPYTPLLVGTIPIGIDVEGSDLDIICCCSNEDSFKNTLALLSGMQGFKIEGKEIDGRFTIIARFILEEFPVEIFGQQCPTREQNAYRHMLVEWALLQKYGDTFRDEIISLRKQGLKTEPAFARLLGLSGDPYQELLYYVSDTLIPR